MRKLLIAALIPASMALAGPLSFGVKAGVPFTDAFKTARSGNLSYVTENKHWTVGPELDINLLFGLSIEVDALYRRLNYESTQTLGDQIAHAATTANAWDFPLLLKWKLAPGAFRPYVSVGPTFRGLTNLKRAGNFFSEDSSSSVELKDRFNTGFTLGSGVQLLGHISPEIRYTRWGWNNFRDTSGLLKTNPDEVTFLVGFTF